MARRRTKKRSQKNAHTGAPVKNLKQEDGSSDSTSKSSSKSVSSVKPTVDQAEAHSTKPEASTEPTHADRVAATLANVEKLLSEANNTSSSDTPDWSKVLEESLRKNQNQLSSQLKQFTQSFEKQLNEMQQAISECLDSESVARINAKTTEQSNNDTTAEDSEKPESDWERQKREMLAEYGDSTPAAKDATKNPKADAELEADATKDDEKSDDADELTSLQESLHDSIESLDEVQAEEIEELRAQLTEKLREAEVELSINRAKLDQRKAELERQQLELERREKSLADKYSNVNGTPQRMGVLDRLTRHLGVRKQADSL